MKIAMVMTVALAGGVLWGCSSRPYTVESVIKAQQEYNARTEPTGPLSTPSAAAPVSAPDPNKPVEQSYRDLKSLHWISVVLGQGNQIKLEDNSIWQVAPVDTVKTRFWSIANTINVANGARTDFPFRLTNADKNEFADVRLVSK